MKRANSMKKAPPVARAKVLFLKIRQSGQMFADMVPALGGGRRERIKRFAMSRRKRKMNARIRVDHLKPRVGKRRCSIRGKIMPPMLPPVVARPVAQARRRWK